jgi:hypothetical protein
MPRARAIWNTAITVSNTAATMAAALTDSALE